MSNVNPLFYERLQKALKRKRILTDKEREKKAKKRGGFDVSDISKNSLKEIEDVHNVCYWCKGQTKAIADETHKTGFIQITCETPGCMGNIYEKKSEIKRTNRKVYGRLIDKELCFDLAKMLIGRDPGRLAVTPQRVIL